MRLSEVTNEELVELRGGYMRDLRHETQASHSVRRQWQIVIAALNELIKARNGGVLPVLDAKKMVRPGEEPLA